MNEVGSWPARSLVEWIAAVEKSAAEAIEGVLDRDEVLAGLTSAWRRGLGALPPNPPPVPLAVGRLPRGGAGLPGHLGADYPHGLWEVTRAGWLAAVLVCELGQRLTSCDPGAAAGLRALGRRIEAAPAPHFAPTAAEQVAANAGFRLRRFGGEPAAARRRADGEPILVVSSLINRWYILDFLPGASFLATLAGLGRPVYLLDPVHPAGGPDERSLADLCAGPLAAAIDRVRDLHRAPGVALVGYSLGGTLAAMAAARYPERVRRLATVCAPIEFARAGRLARWFSARYLDVDLLASRFERLPADLVHLPFWWLRPTIKWQKLARLALDQERPGQERPGALDKFLAGEVWNHDNVDLPRGVFRSWLRDLYQEDALARGHFLVDGAPADLARITGPLLVVTGARDDIAPPAAAEALLDRSSAISRQPLRLDTSHVGVLSSARALAAQREAFARWLEQTP